MVNNKEDKYLGVMDVLIQYMMGGKNVQQRKESLLDKWLQGKRSATCKTEIRTFSIITYKNKLQNGLKDLNVNYKTPGRKYRQNIL